MKRGSDMPAGVQARGDLEISERMTYVGVGIDLPVAWPFSASSFGQCIIECKWLGNSRSFLLFSPVIAAHPLCATASFGPCTCEWWNCGFNGYFFPGAKKKRVHIRIKITKHTLIQWHRHLIPIEVF